MSRTPILFAVLGMLKLHPMTGYEIKQVYQRGPANFMPISFGQIYPVLAKLKQGKMVRQNKQQGGRRTIRYSLTPKGEESFRKWLVSAGDAANYKELLLRLFFAAPPELADLRGHIEAFRREEQASLDHYEATRQWLDTARAGNPRLPIWKMVMEYGVLQSQFRMLWAERTLAFMTNRNRSKTL